MTYTAAAVERAMKVQEVILRALSGRQTWLQVADVLGVSPRTVRRLRWRYEHDGYDGLFDRRRRVPSPRRVPVAEVQRILRLYRERYLGFNVRHFYQTAVRDHGVRFSYTLVKRALQAAGLVRTRRPRGRHRRRRAPRPCFGELLHLDGSLHPWLALVPATRQTLLVVLDDATKHVLYAQLVEGGESLEAILTALRAVLETHGIPGALYTDRAGWAVYTPTSGTAPDRTKRTQVGRALARLGIEHIVSFSPQARGRSERANGTLQGRLVNELRVAGIRTIPAANRYLRERFIPEYNARFGRAPTDPTSAFVPVGRHDLDQILYHEEERVVARDNTVVLDRVVFQLDKQRGRRSCAGLRVLVRRHLDGRHSNLVGAPVPGPLQRPRPAAPAQGRLTWSATRADRSRVKRERSNHLSTTGRPLQGDRFSSNSRREVGTRNALAPSPTLSAPGDPLSTFPLVPPAGARIAPLSGRSQGSWPDRDRRTGGGLRGRSAAENLGLCHGRAARATRGRAGEALPIRSSSINGPNPVETVRSAWRRAHRAAPGARAPRAGLGRPDRVLCARVCDARRAVRLGRPQPASPACRALSVPSRAPSTTVNPVGQFGPRRGRGPRGPLPSLPGTCPVE